MKKYLLLLSILWIVSQHAFTQTADIILTKGKIFTSDTSKLYVQALAIKNNKIVAVGTDAEIQKLVDSKTKRINLQGKTVVPGFNDAHDHPGFFSPVSKFFNNEFSVTGPDKKSVIDSVTRLVKTAKPGEWINGMIGMTTFSDTTISKALDSVAPGNPVALQNMWGHGTVLNSYALKLLHISDNEPDPLGGWYVRKTGSDTITGAMYEYAQWPAWKALSAVEPEYYMQGLKLYAGEQIKMGITTVQFMNLSPFINDYFVRAELEQRIRLIPFVGTTKNKRDTDEWRNIDNHPTSLIYVSGVKYLIDGTDFEEACFNRKSYPSKPKWYGRTNMPVDTIKQILKEAYNGNTQLMMHIVGDSSMNIVLTLMKQFGNDAVWRTKRVRFEHNATAKASEEDIQMIKDMGIIMAHTPKYGDKFHLQSFLDKHIIVAVSPDGTTNPFWDIMVMTSQQTNPTENITVEEAVIAYTKTNAYAEFAEKEKGTLMPGMLADLTVLSQDIFTIPKEQLPATKSVLTMVDGKIVYEQY